LKTQRLNIEISKFIFKVNCSKKVVFVLLLLICVSFVSAIEIDLTKDIYSNNVNFQGNLIINKSNIDVTKIVTGDVKECDYYEEKTIELYDLLINSGFDIGPKEVFMAGASTSNYQVTLEDNQTDLVGLLINGNLNQLNFSVSGSGSGFYIDVGVDGKEEWHYVGEFSNWGDIINPENYDGSYNLTNIYEVNPHDQRCSEVNVSFDEMVGELLVNVEVFAKGGTVDDQLIAKIGGKSCTLTGMGSNNWGLASCSMSLDSSRYDNPNVFEVCIWSSSNSFRIPSRVQTDFYFTRLKIAEHDESLGSPIYVSDSKLINEINSYYNECDKNWCLIPMRLRLKQAGQVNLNNLFARSLTGSEFTSFNEVDSETIKVNLTGKPISLSAFLNLKTPDVEEDVCILKMEFEGEYDEASFDVSAGPTPIIDVSSRYMAKGYEIDFDGSNSLSRNNRSIVSWAWSFGDGINVSGIKVVHTYNNYGNYSVTLTLKDSSGAEASSSIAMHIIPLEQHLTNQFMDLDTLFPEAKLNGIALKADVAEFYDYMNYNAIIEENENLVEDLKLNFTSIKNSEIVDKEPQYASIANRLHSVLKVTPLNMAKKGSKNIRNLLIAKPSEIFDYSGRAGYTPAYADAVYEFNKNNVDVNMDSTLIGVEFFEGRSNYIYVRKSINAREGSNKVIVEDLRKITNNLDNVIGGSKENYSRTIYWDMSANQKDIKYVVKADNLETINTIVYSDVDIAAGDIYCFDDPSCGKYCGDGVCTIADYLGIDESSELSNNYCPGDCVINNSKIKYIVLFIIFFLFLVYLLFYKGPGSIKDIVNRLSYGVSGKKPFVTDRDKATLKDFIDLSLKRGFNQMQIRDALMKKGWNKSQIDVVMNSSIKK